MVDIIITSATIDINISNLSCHFLSGNGPIFGHTKQDFGKILEGICKKFVVEL